MPRDTRKLWVVERLVRRRWIAVEVRQSAARAAAYITERGYALDTRIGFNPKDWRVREYVPRESK